MVGLVIGLMPVIYGSNGADLQRLESESVVDVSTSYQLRSGIELRLQVNNVTDEPVAHLPRQSGKSHRPLR